jgi:hypothetical protein
MFARPPLRDEPRRERRRRQAGRPLDDGAGAEHPPGGVPAAVPREGDAGDDGRGRHEVEPELPEEGVRRPERDERGERGAPPRAQERERGDLEQVERRHQQAVRVVRAAAEQRLEGEERDRTGGVRRGGEDRVQQRAALRVVDEPRVGVPVHAERDVRGEQSELRACGEHEQRAERATASPACERVDAHRGSASTSAVPRATPASSRATSVRRTHTTASARRARRDRPGATT